LAAIKQKYRALVRQHHPDIAADKIAATRHMVLILEAWRVLSDPLERERYDRDCRERARRAAIAAAAPDVTSPHTHARPHINRVDNHGAHQQAAARKPPAPSRPAGSAPSKAQSGKPTSSKANASWGSKAQPSSRRSRLLDKTVEAAQHSFAEGSTNEAITICKRILQIEPKNAPAAALLGDIFAQQGQQDMAVLMYGRAALSQPANPVYRWKLDTMRRAAATTAPATAESTATDRPQPQARPTAPSQPTSREAMSKTTIFITANAQLSRPHSRRISRLGCAGPLLLVATLAGTALTPLLISLWTLIGHALP